MLFRFIGSQFALRSLEKYYVIGIDNFDNYYSVLFKKRKSYSSEEKNFKFYKLDIKYLSIK